MNSRLKLPGWALVLGASSGIGAATATTLARAGCDIVGVHLDRRSALEHVRAVENAVRAAGRQAWFFNTNAADEQRRDEILDEVQARFADGGCAEPFRVMLHSLAFGSLLPLLGPNDETRTTRRQLEMTFNVMAHSLVSWAQALAQRDLVAQGSRIFAMTSTGARSVWNGYGAVSAAKAALESHVRQLAVEFAPRGVTVNAICAGVTDTPALRKIPAFEKMLEVAMRKNPNARLTRPEDVAAAILALAQPETYWLTGNVIQVDGGEGVVG
ncbi:MAG: SDR family oxidoreductase [Polyangiaceae bacterium]|jgi:NAD(P)-dependent dehydrogenase (short-subunit alcohol dehydrogenase family)|nr:SDR family oxidoreductase [Polyangiaceae bacterium]